MSPVTQGPLIGRILTGLKSIDKTSPKALTDGTAMWEEDDGFIYYKGKLYVPKDRVLRRDVVKL